MTRKRTVIVSDSFGSPHALNPSLPFLVDGHPIHDPSPASRVHAQPQVWGEHGVEFVQLNKLVCELWNVTERGYYVFDDV